MESRSKHEIVREIEEDRDEVTAAVNGTKYALTDGNPAVRMWRKTKCATIETKNRIASKAQETKIKMQVKAEAADMTIRENVYRSIITAICLGAFVGFLAKKKFSKK